MACADRASVRVLRESSPWFRPIGLPTLLRAAMGAIAVLSMTLSIAVAGAAADSSSEACANAGVRTGYSASLPDCRAYEVVSPPGVEPFFNTQAGTGNVGPGDVIKGAAWAVQASADGDRLGFYSTYVPPPGSVSDGPYYLSKREEGDWRTENVVPPQSVTNTGRSCFNAYVPAYTPDLSSWILADGWGQEGHPFEKGTENFCGVDDPLLVPGEPEGFQNLFLKRPEAPYQLINATPQATTPNHAWFQDASEDLSRVVFSEEAQLTSDAPIGGEDLYEASNGQVRLVTYLPDGTPVQGRMALDSFPELQPPTGLGPAQYTHPVSADGSRVYFVAEEKLFLRENAEQPQSAIDGEGHCREAGKACTVEIDESQGGAGVSGGGELNWVSVDGAHAFFTDTSQLTPDSGAAPGEPDLYEYDLNAPAGQRLTDVSVNSVNPSEPADVLNVDGMSDSGGPSGYVYFVATGALSADLNSSGDQAVSGQPNLYVRHEGAVAFIATLDPTADVLDWTPRELTVRTSSDGAFVAFNSVRSLTGYDNTDVNSATPDQEIFLYDAGAKKLSCASCDPSGAPPSAPARIRLPVTTNLFFNTVGRLQRNLSDNGRVFFDTADSLLSSAQNGQPNVYEYEEGQVRLISNGTGAAPAYFYEASANGDDVFLFTSNQLLPSDQDGGITIYDARVDGGFNPAAAPAPPCEGEACRGPSSPPPAAITPASSSFNGPGDAPPPPPAPAPKPKPLTNAQKLSKALRTCRGKQNKRKRAACETQARKRYAPKRKPAAKKQAKTNKGSK
jgi:hypothetical protein